MQIHSTGSRTKRAAIYARVSTDDQAENGYSLDDQERKGRAQAIAKGWEVVEDRYVDDGYSGTLRHRPALDRLLADIKAGKIDVVIVTKMDRLARSLKLLLELWDTVESYGATVVVIEESIDTSTSVGRLIRNVLGSIAEFERDTILARTMAGKRAKIARDEVLRTSASAPYAYRYVLRDKSTHTGGELEIIEELRPTVVRIFELVAGGMSTIKVADLLTREGVPTQRGRPRWGFATVGQIIKNTTYMGQAPHRKHVVVGKTEDGKQRRERREPDAEDYTTCPAVVSEEVWRAANEQLGTNQKESRRNAKHDYLLGGGLLKCGLCGYTMTGIHRAKNALYYRCSHFDADGSRITHTVNGHEVERAVWGHIATLLTDESEVLDAYRQLSEEGSRQAQELEDEVRALARALADTETQADRLLDLYLSGGLAKKTYEAKQAALDERSQHLHDKLEDLRSRRETALQSVWQVEGYQVWRERYPAGTERMTFAEKRAVLRDLRITVVATAEGVRVEGYLPSLPLDVSLSRYHQQGVERQARQE